VKELMNSDITDIRVLVVEDCGWRRDATRKALESLPGICVVALVGTGEDAVRTALELGPAVITMGVEMAELGGLSAIEEIMARCPTPIVIIGSTKQAPEGFGVDALRRGALDFVAARTGSGLDADLLMARVRICARVAVITHPRSRRLTAGGSSLGNTQGYQVVGVAVSTGGPPALQSILSRLPETFPVPVIVVQHIPKGFSEGLTSFLDANCHMSVVEAVDGAKLEPGVVYVAPAGYHVVVTRHRRIELLDSGFEECHHMPSADVMLRSLADVYGSRAVGIIMTGMGRDGVDGIRAIREAGGLTLAQDEESSLIYGMNKVATEAGWIRHVVPLKDLAGRLISLWGDGGQGG